MKKMRAEKAEEVVTLMGGELDLATEIAKESEEVQRLIKAGEIVADITVSKRKVDGKMYSKQYLRLKPTTGVAVVALQPVETTWKKETDKDGNDISDFDGPCWVKDFFYGNDLGVKNRESQRLAVLVERSEERRVGKGCRFREDV